MPADDISLDPKHYPQLDGLRHDGKRWVDALYPDRPMLQILPQKQEGQDMFGGSGIRRSPKPKPRKMKSRRRGGFSA